MHLVHPPRAPDPERLHVLAAQLRVWALEICVWLAGLVGRRMPRAVRIMLREDIREVLFRARLLIFLLAVLRRDRKPFYQCTVHPESAPRGFRRTCDDTTPLRRVKRAARLRGRTIRARVAELRDMLCNLARWVQRMLAHLERGPHGAGLVLREVFAEAARDHAPAHAPSMDARVHASIRARSGCQPSILRANSRSAGLSTPFGNSATTPARIVMPISSARSCSSFSRNSSGEGFAATKRSSASRRYT